MRFVIPLTDASAGHRHLCGGKGAGLHWLLERGFRVPAGFVVSSSAFSAFASRNRLAKVVASELSKVSPRRHLSVSDATKHIQQFILDARVPESIIAQIMEALDKYKGKKFAVRSSAAFEDNEVQSWAGQFDSYLDIKREQIPQYVKKCWASLFNVRAMTYLYTTYTGSNLPRYAVVVQEMVPSEVSGVAFSIDPRRARQDRILIEAVYGHGDKLVSGRDISSSVLVDKTSGVVASSQDRGRELVLVASQVKTLCSEIVRMERAFRHPIDVEWSFAKRRFSFLQVRPITTGQKHSQRVIQKEYPDIDDYELTFKVQGLSFLLTSVLAVGFRYLDPLFTSNADGAFAQYFTKVKMDYAASYGVRWFGKPGSVATYQQKFSDYYERNVAVMEKILTKRALTREDVKRIFRVMTRCFTYYSKSDNEFTDAAFPLMVGNPTIARNMKALSKFKDVARLWINELVIDENSFLARVCLKISEQFRVSRSDIECYGIEEVVGLFDGLRIHRRVVESRRRSYCMYYADRRLAHLTGTEAIAYIKRSASKTRTITKFEVKGRVANGSDRLVFGRAMVINVDYGNIGEMNAVIAKMKKGDVLIADFTAPELMEACRKARAIVTDIGGLLSHAAIISRELGLPCIVGTVNATKVFRTGDRVEVDCESGLVRLAMAAPKVALS